jgi:SAM-dependent methyltransferase
MIQGGLMRSEIIENICRSYDNHAQDREKDVMQDWKIAPRRDFLNLLQKEGKKTLLEIGAGHGRDSRFFQDNGLCVTAVDISNEMVKLCVNKGINAYQMDFFHLSELEAKFDAVWAMNCLLHVEKAYLEDVFKEINAILKISGLFFMGVYGGEDKEGIWEDDPYTPKRFYSSFSDNEIQRKVSDYFDIVNFNAIETGGKNHFQALVLRKKG